MTALKAAPRAITLPWPHNPNPFKQTIMKYLLSLLAAALLCSCGDYNTDGNKHRQGNDTLNQESPYNTPGAEEHSQPDKN